MKPARDAVTTPDPTSRAAPDSAGGLGPGLTLGLTRRTAAILVALLTLAALAQRFVGIGYMLPHQPEPDAVIVWQAAWFERPADAPPDDNVQMAPFYPYLLSRVLAALPGHSYRRVLPPDRPIAEHLAAASEPYLRGRILIALMSVIAIPGTYRLARAFLSRGWSLAAAAFFATSLLDLSYAQQARPHCASCSLSLLAVLAALRVARKPTLGALVVACAAAFLAIGALHNGVFVLPSLALAIWFARERRWFGLVLAATAFAAALAVWYPFLFRAGVFVLPLLVLAIGLAIACVRRRRWVDLGIVAAFAIGALLVCLPRLFRFDIFKPDEGGQIDVGGQTVEWGFVSLQGFVRIVRGLWGYDPILLVLGGAGWIAALVALFSRGPRALPGALPGARAAFVVGAFPVAFLAVWGVLATVWPRFTIQLLPYLALGAALSLRSVLPRLLPRGLAPRARAVAVVTLVLVLLAVPAGAGIQLVRLRAREDTQVEAARWIERNARREDDVIATNFLLTLPLFAERGAIEALPVWFRGPWEQYQLALPPGAPLPAWKLRPIFRRGFLLDTVLSVEETQRVLDEEGPRWAVVVVPTAQAVAMDETREAVRARAGHPVDAFLPFDLEHTQLLGSGFELGFHALERVIESSAWGPPIEIYRLGK